MNTIIIELQQAVESANNYIEKANAFTALCNAFISPQYANELMQTSSTFLELAEKHNDPKSQAWATLYNGMALSFSNKLEESNSKFTSALTIFEQLNDKAGIARTLLNIGRYFMFQKDYQKAIEYFKNAVVIEIELESSDGVTRILGNLPYPYQQMGNIDELRAYFQQHLEVLGNHRNTGFIADIYITIGSISMINLSDYQFAISTFEKAVLLYQTLGNKVGESETLGYIGGGYWYLGEAGISIEYALQSIAIAEEAGERKNLQSCLTNAAYPYMYLEDFQKVLELNQRAKELASELQDLRATGWADMGIAMALLRLGDAQSALEHAQNAVDMLEKTNDKHGLGYAYFRRAESLVALEQFDTAFEAFNKSLEIRKFINAELEIAETECEIGKLLVKFGSYNEALTMLHQALSLAEKIAGKAVIYASHKALSAVYSSLEDFTKAFFHIEKYIMIRDEVNSQESSKKAASMEYLHKQELHRKELEATDRILNNVLPISITKRLKSENKIIAEKLSDVSVLFADIVGFTKISQHVTPEELVDGLDRIFSEFDALSEEYGLEKIKTIGDAYMVVSGAPIPRADHAEIMAIMALKMLESMHKFTSILNDEKIQLRIGIHCGEVVAGVIGKKKFTYDLWGDAVNTASRMESHGEPGKIHVSEEFRNALISTTLNALSIQFIPRGEMDIKGKGMMKTYFLEKAQ